jgi:capsular polysaccharide biosynthesis protein
MPPSHREALTLLYGSSCPIIEVPAFTTVRIQRLWCAPAPSYMPLHEIRNARFTWDAVSAAPSILVPLARELQQRFEAAAATPRPSASSRAIYLARKAFRHRRLTNSEQIEAVARTLGLDAVYPEDLTFAEQAALARHADLIVAPEGSAIFLSLFARPGASSLCILSHPLTDYLADYAGLLTPLRVHVMAITGPISRYREDAPNDSDYCIDEDTFRQVVMDLLSRRTD